MKVQHIAFCLEHAYGHVIPTLGLAKGLIKRGHRVTYAVTKSLEPAIRRIGAAPVVMTPLETREQLCNYTARADGTNDFNESDQEFSNLLVELRTKRTEDSLQQLTALYKGDRPDLIVHDDCLDFAGRSLATKWKIKRIHHHPVMLLPSDVVNFKDSDLVLVSVPRFFQRDPDNFDSRVRFIGFCPEGRTELFDPWPFKVSNRKTILVSATTGLLSPLKFYQMVISAFRDQEWRVILCIGAAYDSLSKVAPEQFANLPGHIEVASSSSTLELLRHADLFIGQGGQGSTLEAIYSGVPSLLIPPSQFHDIVAQRIVELGLGARIPIAEATPEKIQTYAASIVEDPLMRRAVSEARASIQRDSNLEATIELIEDLLFDRAITKSG